MKPYLRITLSSMLSLLLILGVAAADDTSQLVVRFSSGAVEPPAGKSAGGILEFSFKDARLRTSLINEGVSELSKLFPSFHTEDLFSTNLIGEPILLDDLSGYYIVSLMSGRAANPEARLRAISGVEYAGRSQMRELLSACPPQNQDTYYPKQWGLNNTGQTLCTSDSVYFPALVADADINAPEAWCITTGDTAVRVGIIDTGIWADHVDLNVNLARGKSFVPLCADPPPPPPPCFLTTTDDFSACDYAGTDVPEDDLSHGTGVAGIVAAVGNNSQGAAGVAWGVTPIAIKAFYCSGFSSSCLSARALDWARTDSIPIVNMSYGGSLDDAERSAARNGFYAGQLLVAAMGNSNNATALYPAAYRNTVCAVGAYFGNGRRWNESPRNPGRGSCFGSWIDLAVPGGNMIATTHWGCRQSTSAYYDLALCGHPSLGNDFGGTSAAAPVVSGIAGLLKSKYPTLLGEDIYQAMIRTARHPDGSAFGGSVVFDDSAGYGHVRADSALNLFAAPNVISQKRITGLYIVAVDTALRVLKNFNIPNRSNDSSYTVVRYRMRKGVTFNSAYTASPMVWARSSGSLGVKDTMTYDKNEEVLWGKVDSLSTTGYRVETNTFKIVGVPGPYDWYPGLPTKAAVAMTSVGVPAGSMKAQSGGGSEPGPSTGDGRPVAFRLRQNEPNPFSRVTRVRFELPARSLVRLEVFDLQGRLLKTLVNGEWPAGFHMVDWDHSSASGRLVGPGVYLYRIEAGDFRDQKKMVLLPQ